MGACSTVKRNGSAKPNTNNNLKDSIDNKAVGKGDAK